MSLRTGHIHLQTVRLGHEKTPEWNEVNHFKEVFSRYIPAIIPITATTPQVTIGRVTSVADA